MMGDDVAVPDISLSKSVFLFCLFSVFSLGVFCCWFVWFSIFIYLNHVFIELFDKGIGG